MTNNVRFTSRSFHFIERPQFFNISLQLCLYFSPCKIFMAVHVLLKTGFQCSEQFFTLLWCQVLLIAMQVSRFFRSHSRRFLRFLDATPRHMGHPRSALAKLRFVENRVDRDREGVPLKR